MSDVRKINVTLDGPWTISVCVDCGRTSLDMSHGKCRRPVRWTLVEVMPRAEVERLREDLESYRQQAINAEAEVERLRGVLSDMSQQLADEGYAKWSREVYDAIGGRQ